MPQQNIPEQNINVGVIGAGNWGKNLIRTFNQLNVLSAVAELKTELRNIIKEQYPKLTVYDNPKPLLESNIPAVVIATDAHTHYELAKEALCAGKDVFVEKPLALSAQEAKDLAALAQKTDRILMVGHLLLYQPAISHIKDYIAEGAIGKIAFLNQERLKLGRVRKVENVLWSFGVHDIAVLLYLAGEDPVNIEAIGQSFLQNDIEDNVYLHLTFPAGIRAHLHTCWLWPEQKRTLTVVGSQGMLVYNELEQKVTLHKKYIGSDLSQKDEGSETVFKGNIEPLLLECNHFLECVKQHRQPLSNAASAVEVIEVLEKAQQQLKGVKV